MSDERPGERRRNGDAEILTAVGNLAERLETNTKSFNRQLEGIRQKQERQLAVTIALQEHKTIERVDVIWETLTEMRAVWNTAKVLGARLVKFGAWGCATVLGIVGLAIAAGLIHFR